MREVRPVSREGAAWLTVPHSRPLDIREGPIHWHSRPKYPASDSFPHSKNIYLSIDHLPIYLPSILSLFLSVIYLLSIYLIYHLSIYHHLLSAYNKGQYKTNIPNSIQQCLSWVLLIVSA
jgi:hypothetical protein